MEGMCQVRVKLQKRYEGYIENDVVAIQNEFGDVLQDEPGNMDTTHVIIEVGDSAPIAVPPYRIPDRLKGSVHVRKYRSSSRRVLLSTQPAHGLLLLCPSPSPTSQ